MRKAPLLSVLAVVIAMAAGIAIGYVLGSGTGGTTTSAPPDMPRGLPADSKESPQPLARDNPEPRPASPDSKAERTLAEIIAALEIPPLPQGDGVITGRVMTAAGDPLEGVLVGTTGSYPEERDLGEGVEDRVRDHIRYEKWRASARREATSGADGRYELRGLAADTNYSLWAKKEGWTFDRSVSSYVQAGGTVDFTARHNIKIKVEVRMPGGELAGNAEVDFRRSSEDYSGITHRLRNGRGEYGLALGDWIAQAKGGEGWVYKSAAHELRIEVDKPPPAIVLQLEGRPGIRGDISVPAGYTNYYYEVKVLAGSSPAPEAFLTDEQREGAVVETHVFREHKAYRFIDIAPGTYHVVLLESGRVLDWRDVTVTNDLVQCDLAVPAARAQDYIPVRVFDPEGNATRDVKIGLQISTAGHTIGGGADVYYPEKDDKLIWVQRWDPRVLGKAVTEYSFELTVYSDLYGQLTQKYGATDTHELQFHFQVAARVTLDVPGYNDNDLRKRLVWSIVPVGAPGQGGDRWDLDRREPEENVAPFKLGPFVPGEYELVLVLGMKHNKREVLRRRVTLVAGQNALSADIPPLYTLKVVCRSEEEAGRVNLTAKGDRMGTWEDEKKRNGAVIEYPELPAGEYVLEIPEGTMKVNLSSDSEVAYAPRTYDCLKLSAIKAGGSVEALGLRNGDRLIAVDGNRFEDMKTFRAHVELSMAKDSTVWTVLRDGIETEVTFSGKALTEIMKDKKTTREDLDLDRDYRDG